MIIIIISSSSSSSSSSSIVLGRRRRRLRALRDGNHLVPDLGIHQRGVQWEGGAVDWDSTI